MEGPEFRGNPKPHHQLFKESAANSQYGAKALPKTVEGEFTIENIEYLYSVGKKGFTGD